MTTDDRLDPIAPGEILLEEFLKPMRISQNRLARDIDVPVSRIADIVAGKRAITADTALRLAAAFGTSAQMWLNLQNEFDLRVLRRTIGPDIEARVTPYGDAA
ncbi:MAG: HigA family addiction module antitoxin [Roseitalea porphyridii]|jgi:addiction module HigA family antidote|uniref:HigA family addiction module antitoxin n=1 Tax=Roseitalea porphyridii TaxID=1852022 RepID=UPI0032D98AE6